MNGFDADVLVVGAGPTGLTLARELHSLGVTVQLVDRAADAVHESRALAIQARTLEVLARNGLAQDLVTAGRPTGQVMLHGSSRTRILPLGDAATADTGFPFLLFLAQSATERILVDRLSMVGAGVRRGLTLTALSQDQDGVTCTLESPGVPTRVVRTRYVVGCDGAHSATRRLTGIQFSGHAFPHRFLLADLEIDGVVHDRGRRTGVKRVGIRSDSAHAYLTGDGPMFLFPLGTPASWRLIVQLPVDVPTDADPSALLREIVARYSRGRLVPHEPVWLTEFSISSRLADEFRRDRVFLAGDAAHIHSPAGAQGMNTGMQDAVNLGWKLALVCRGDASPTLLRSYPIERMPVARSVLTRTDRAFRLATSGVPVLRSLRAAVVGRVAGLVSRSEPARRAAFRLIAQLDVSYPVSPLSVEGEPRLIDGPRAGERYPTVTPTQPAAARATVDRPVFRLLLCGPAQYWPEPTVQTIQDTWAHLIDVERRPHAPVSRWSEAASPHDAAAQYLLRWDGYVGYRAAGTDLAGVEAYLVGLGGRARAPRPGSAR